MMALADVLTRLAVIYSRGRRLAAAPAAPAAAAAPAAPAAAARIPAAARA